MERTAIISGMYDLRESCFSAWEKLVRSGPQGEVEVYVQGRHVFLPRHGNPAARYLLPHLIDHRVHLAILKELDVGTVIGINSTGSLKRSLLPGTYVVPHDFILLYPYRAACLAQGPADHIVPSLHEGVRKKIIAALIATKVPFATEGVYWQTPGPRLETKAEIRLMANFADLVGMTMASEAIAAHEQGLAYASLCSVDNWAHGLGEGELSLAEITDNARRQRKHLEVFLEHFLTGSV
jgi:5'-methylthioadenosine phosphorylase